jgi:hypothetical protein
MVILGLIKTAFTRVRFVFDCFFFDPKCPHSPMYQNNENHRNDKNDTKLKRRAFIVNLGGGHLQGV